jgi:hypothetical protein
MLRALFEQMATGNARFEEAAPSPTDFDDLYDPPPAYGSDLGLC